VSVGEREEKEALVHAVQYLSSLLDLKMAIKLPLGEPQRCVRKQMSFEYLVCAIDIILASNHFSA
jgi:hypothetical protein